jgi:hypothetical protein
MTGTSQGENKSTPAYSRDHAITSCKEVGGVSWVEGALAGWSITAYQSKTRILETAKKLKSFGHFLQTHLPAAANIQIPG